MKLKINLFSWSLLLLFVSPVFAGESVIDTGDTAWIIVSTALVMMMTPAGLALFYGGLVRTKNVLGTMMHSFVAIAIIGVLWAVCGYALTFGENILGGFVGWNSDYFFLKGIDDTIVSGVPEYVLAMFQGKFAIITPALISGALACVIARHSDAIALTTRPMNLPRATGMEDWHRRPRNRCRLAGQSEPGRR